MINKEPTLKEKDFILFMDFMFKNTQEILRRVEQEGRECTRADLPEYEELSELFDLYKVLGLHK